LNFGGNADGSKHKSVPNTNSRPKGAHKGMNTSAECASFS